MDLIGTARRIETDAQLVARLREGDIAAFGSIVERHRAALVARANARLGSFADAEDAAQEAFVQAYFHLHELRDPDALLPWLRRVTDNVVLMHLRKRREHPIAPEDMEAVAAASPTGEAGVEHILAQLPEDMRETVSLTFLAGYTCAEAARILGVKEGTVKSRLNRARAKLREALGMTQRDPANDFTRRTIERLKQEARRLVAEGRADEAAERAELVLAEQVKPLFGDPQKLGVAKTFLAAFDSASFRPDEEAVSMLGLPHRERRRRECEANAAQYGFRLKELDWKLADVDIMSGTLAKPTGVGRDTWGVPVSRMDLDVVDARALCQRLRVSPLVLHQWVNQGCPVLRCWPWVRFDVDRVRAWLLENGISQWPEEDDYHLERPIRVIFREVHEGRLSAAQAEQVMRDLGHSVWEAPMPPNLRGGW